MTDKDEFGRLLADNLKALNAKERDHLMRFAYLGEEEASYEGRPGRFLSKTFLNSLRQELDENIPELEEKDCLFAGMDYHIDWLYAALFMAAKGLEIKEGGSFGPYDRAVYSNDGGSSDAKPDLRPVLGNQEDVDLLVLLDARDAEKGGAGKLHLVFIEAKGMDSFDPVQLGRKLIRVNRSIREASEAVVLMDWLDFTYLLLSASDPGVEGYVDYVTEINNARKRCENKEDQDPLPGIVEQLKGEGLNFNPNSKWLEMKNYPEKLWQVQRCDKGGAPKVDFKSWKLVRRKARSSGKPEGK